MKKLFLLFALLAICATAFPAEVKLAWDNQVDWPSDTVIRIYEHVGESYNLVATSTPLATQVPVANVTSGIHRYVARAYSSSLGIESNNSNEVEAKLLLPPGNLKYTIVITISN